jgi:hypothetical protein
MRVAILLLLAALRLSAQIPQAQAQAFVMQAWQSVLQRQPTVAGVQTVINEITAGTLTEPEYLNTLLTSSEYLGSEKDQQGVLALLAPTLPSLTATITATFSSTEITFVCNLSALTNGLESVPCPSTIPIPAGLQSIQILGQDTWSNCQQAAANLESCWFGLSFNGTMPGEAVTP